MTISPEHTPEDNAELAMLRSDLAELFQTHSDMLSFRVSEDLNEPTEVVLGGTCKQKNASDKKQVGDIEVHIRQRIDDMGTDYLILAGTPGDYAWCRIADNYACELSREGDRPLTDKAIASVRLFVNPTITSFTLDLSSRFAVKKGLYEIADKYTNKN